MVIIKLQSRVLQGMHTKMQHQLEPMLKEAKNTRINSIMEAQEVADRIMPVTIQLVRMLDSQSKAINKTTMVTLLLEVTVANTARAEAFHHRVTPAARYNQTRITEGTTRTTQRSRVTVIIRQSPLAITFSVSYKCHILEFVNLQTRRSN